MPRATFWSPIKRKETLVGSPEKSFVATTIKQLGHCCRRLQCPSPESLQDKVGNGLCPRHNTNSEYMYDLLPSSDFNAPLTFQEMHNGPSETWWHSSGSASRLDYILINPEAGNSVLGYQATALRLQKIWYSHLKGQKNTGIDWKELGRGENRAWLCSEISKVPVAAWTASPTVQAQQLSNQLISFARTHFPLRCIKYRKPVRQLRQKTLSQLRNCHRLSSETTLRFAWCKLAQHSHIGMHTASIRMPCTSRVGACVSAAHVQPLTMLSAAKARFISELIRSCNSSELYTRSGFIQATRLPSQRQAQTPHRSSPNAA